MATEAKDPRGTVKVDPDLMEQIRKLAAANDRKIQAEVGRALREYLERMNP